MKVRRWTFGLALGRCGWLHGFWLCRYEESDRMPKIGAGKTECLKASLRKHACIAQHLQNLYWETSGDASRSSTPNEPNTFFFYGPPENIDGFHIFRFNFRFRGMPSPSPQSECGPIEVMHSLSLTSHRISLVFIRLVTEPFLSLNIFSKIFERTNFHELSMLINSPFFSGSTPQRP